MRLNLFYLAQARYGGWVSYVEHWLTCLLDQGIDAQLFRIGTRTESHARPFGDDGFHYWNLAPEAAIGAAEAAPSVVLAFDKKSVNALPWLVNAGAWVVVHDPTELRDKAVLEPLRAARGVICIRPGMGTVLAAAGVQAHFVQHPYHSSSPVFAGQRNNAVAFSRLDWDKHTDIIVAANAQLEPWQRCAIYGAENRLFTHHKLPDGWRRDYRGSFQRSMGAPAMLAAQHRFAVDLSVIAGDGDGSQYTFLEAWDGGAVQVVNSRWLTGAPDPLMVPGWNCVAVSDADDLTALLRQGMTDADRLRICQAGAANLRNHAAGVVVPRLLNLLTEGGQRHV